MSAPRRTAYNPLTRLCPAKKPSKDAKPAEIFIPRANKMLFRAVQLGPDVQVSS